MDRTPNSSLKDSAPSMMTSCWSKSWKSKSGTPQRSQMMSKSKPKSVRSIPFVELDTRLGISFYRRTQLPREKHKQGRAHMDISLLIFRGIRVNVHGSREILVYCPRFVSEGRPSYRFGVHRQQTSPGSMSGLPERIPRR